MTDEKQDGLLDAIEAAAFSYFVHETSPTNGLVLDKTRDDWPASIAAVGLGLTAYAVGVERGLMARDEACERTLTALRFFLGAPQGREPGASGYKGFFYHFLDLRAGARVWNCELSTVDSALLFAGMLVAAQYFDRDSAGESEIRTLATAIYERADWSWALNGGPTLTHGWRPDRFLPYRWQGYDEALILYLLALGSPTHPIPPECYAAWASTYTWRTVYDVPYLYQGPLFTHQLSHVWVDFRGIRDAYMRDRGIDYFENSRRATLVQREYAIRNPRGYEHYGPLCWGITASDGPGHHVRQVNGVERRFYDYLDRGVPDGPDDGTIAPWAVVASLPFAPEIVLPTLADFARWRVPVQHRYGFRATFNPTFEVPGRQHGWVSPYHFGINQGPIVAMIANHRNDLVWRLMRRCPPLVRGLRRAGFRGGWLDDAQDVT